MEALPPVALPFGPPSRNSPTAAPHALFLLSPLTRFSCCRPSRTFSTVAPHALFLLSPLTLTLSPLKGGERDSQGVEFAVLLVEDFQVAGADVEIGAVQFDFALVFKDLYAGEGAQVGDRDLYALMLQGTLHVLA